MSALRLGDFFSRYTPGNANTPKKKHDEDVQRHVETNRYRYRDLVQVYKNGDMATTLKYNSNEEEEPMIFCRESHVCGASVDSQYYAPGGYIERGKRVSTKRVCCHCYSDIRLTKNKYVEAREERRVQGYLHM